MAGSDRCGALQTFFGARPWTAMGTGGLTCPDGQGTIRSACESGYRVFDTAFSHNNERDVGQTLENAGHAYTITKLPGRAHGELTTAVSIRDQLDALGCAAIELHLIHWPLPGINSFVESWQAKLRVQNTGLVKDVGVSNFTIPMVEQLELLTGVLPAVVQIKCHSWWPQHDTVRSQGCIDYGLQPTKEETG